MRLKYLITNSWPHLCGIQTYIEGTKSKIHALLERKRFDKYLHQYLYISYT